MAAVTDSSFLPVTCSLGFQFLPEPFQALSPTCSLPSPPQRSKEWRQALSLESRRTKYTQLGEEPYRTGLGNDQNEPGVYLAKNLGRTKTPFMDTSMQKTPSILWHNIWLCTYEQALFEANRCCIGKKRMQDVKKAQLMDENWLLLPQVSWDFRITLTEATEKRTPCCIPQKL